MLKNLFPLLLASLLGGGIAVGGVYLLTRHNKVSAAPTETAFVKQVSNTNFGAASFDFTEAAERSMPTVVHIRTSESDKQMQQRQRQNPFGGGGQNPFGSLFGEDFFGGMQRGPQQGFGSGVIVSEDGYIVTNNHVVDFGDDVKVTLYDNREFPAKVVGTDKTTDIAVLKIDAKNLAAIRYGDSDKAKVGQWVLAVGNPRNLTSTVTAGIISAKGRDIHINQKIQGSIESFIQTDAAVNPGNSGGALVNTNGELVGINTAIITKSGRYEGYSFAVPSNLVMKVIRDLRDFGTAQRGVLGVSIGNVTGKIAESLNLPSAEGVVIQRITPSGSADDAGLREGDIIVGINDAKIRATPDLQEQVGRYRPGNKIEIRFIRDGKNQKVQLTLKNRGNTTDLIAANKDGDGANKILQNIGFDLRNLTREELRRMRLQAGVYVSSITVGSRAERTNMDPGFVITKINEQSVANIEDIINILGKATGKVILEGVYENFPGEYYYAFPM